jgi:hypothetical protein
VNADSRTSLDEFPLGWRFTSIRLGKAAGDIVRRISPLRSDAAAGIALAASRRTPADDTAVQTIRSDDPPGSVRDRLHALPIDEASIILLSWNDDTAAAADWAIFVAHWDDFCYPASDNVVVWAPDGDWTLRYHHYEVFQFWRHPAMERDRA